MRNQSNVDALFLYNRTVCALIGIRGCNHPVVFSQFRFFNIEIVTIRASIFNSSTSYTGSGEFLALQIMGKLVVAAVLRVVTPGAGALALTRRSTGGLQNDLLVEIMDTVDRQNLGDEHRLTVAAGGACIAFFRAVRFYGGIGRTGDMGSYFQCFCLLRAAVPASIQPDALGNTGGIDRDNTVVVAVRQLVHRCCVAVRA